MDDDARCTKSSGNVFADLGLEDADVLLAEAKRRRWELDQWASDGGRAVADDDDDGDNASRV